MHLAPTPTAPTTLAGHDPECQRAALKAARENLAECKGIDSPAALLPSEEVEAQEWAGLYLDEGMTTCRCEKNALDIIREARGVLLLREDSLFVVADRDQEDQDHVRNARFFQTWAPAFLAFTGRVQNEKAKA